MTEEPRTTRGDVRARQKRVLRRVGMGISALMVLLVLITFGFIVRNERAHDESRCKFVEHSTKRLGATRVVEERRSCLPDVEERRYLVQRPDAKAFELARKRMPEAQFKAERYTWSLREDDQRRVILRIDVDGKLRSEFFEEDVPHER